MRNSGRLFSMGPFLPAILAGRDDIESSGAACNVTCKAWKPPYLASHFPQASSLTPCVLLPFPRGGKSFFILLLLLNFEFLGFRNPPMDGDFREHLLGPSYYSRSAVRSVLCDYHGLYTVVISYFLVLFLVFFLLSSSWSEHPVRVSVRVRVRVRVQIQIV